MIRSLFSSLSRCRLKWVPKLRGGPRVSSCRGGSTLVMNGDGRRAVVVISLAREVVGCDLVVFPGCGGHQSASEEQSDGWLRENGSGESTTSPGARHRERGHKVRLRRVAG